MTIQWYPGHMHKAQKEIKEALPKVDIVIEVIDARIPYSSTNPLVAKFLTSMTNPKPVIRVLNKSDLADAEITELWREEFDRQDGTKSLSISSKHPEQVKKIVQLCHKLFPGYKDQSRTINAMIMGIPNVGKSTIINILSDRTITKTGNEPAVTKRQQRIDLDCGITLYDTPGFLWPKIENDHSSYRLAITGAIKDAVIDYDDIAYYAAEYILEAYPELLLQNFQLEKLQTDVTLLLESMGRRRGCLQSGGRVDLDRICKIFIYEFRNFSMGNISLETPKMIEQELIEVEEKIRLKAEKDQLRKKSRKKRKR
ncbi:MAG: ribosome biogenesis GTPase YlqF [Gammaproteobacteria bacterium]|nr:MAG: ribosome biogenesis GTPase YlqF [Gammaproteobacteria bacterium]